MLCAYFNEIFQHFRNFYAIYRILVPIESSHHRFHDIDIYFKILESFGKMQTFCYIFPQHD